LRPAVKVRAMAKLASTAAARVQGARRPSALDAPGVSAETASAVAGRVGVVVCLGLALLLTSVVAYELWRLGMLHFDFEGTVWEPSRAIVAGDSPFPAADRAAVDVANPALYPPSIVLVALPLLALPFAAAAWLWTAALAAAAVGALLVLGVRDPRCFAALLFTYPFVLALGFGNITLLLVLAAALAWAYRDRPLVAGAAVGGAVALKLFLWPLAVWLVATRRYRAALASAAIGLVAVAVPWAAIGFDGLREYPRLLRTADEVFADQSNSLFSAALGLGLDTGGARLVALAVGAALLAGVVVLARRRDRDAGAFSAAMGAALVLSPIVWPHYFTLLVVPIAIYRPRFDRLWLVLTASWLVFVALPLPDGSTAGRPADVPERIWEGLHLSEPPLWQTLGYTLLLATVLVVTLRRRPQSPA
jgi:alpha-1,2-mannosyltransferase